MRRKLRVSLGPHHDTERYMQILIVLPVLDIRAAELVVDPDYEPSTLFLCQDRVINKSNNLFVYSGDQVARVLATHKLNSIKTEIVEKSIVTVSHKLHLAICRHDASPHRSLFFAVDKFSYKCRLVD